MGKMNIEKVKKGWKRIYSGTVHEGDVVYSMNHHYWYGNGWRWWDTQMEKFPGNYIGQKVSRFHGVARRGK